MNDITTMTKHIHTHIQLNLILIYKSRHIHIKPILLCNDITIQKEKSTRKEFKYTFHLFTYFIKQMNTKHLVFLYTLRVSRSINVNIKFIEKEIFLNTTFSSLIDMKNRNNHSRSYLK